MRAYKLLVKYEVDNVAFRLRYEFARSVRVRSSYYSAQSLCSPSHS